MKLETIKRNNKKKIIIGSMIVLSVVGCITLTTTRAKYRNVQTLKLASGTVKLNQYDFKIMAMYQQKEAADCTEDSCYDELTGRMPSSGYIINEEKSYCSIDGKDKDTEAVLKTIDGNHVIGNLVKNEKCYIWFDELPLPPMSIDNIIANIETRKDGSYKGTSTPTFTSVATGTETEDNNGIYKAEDGMYGGYSFYWRGAAATNHVIFGNYCWRIVRINGDKTVRLIYNGPVQSGNVCIGNENNSGSIATNGVYNSNYNRSEYAGWTYNMGSQRTISGTSSSIKSSTESWLNDNLDEIYKEQLANGKFCNDRNTGNKGSNWAGDWETTYTTSWSSTGIRFAYAAVDRIYNKHQPTLSCLKEDTYELNAGAITIDELKMGGAYLWNGAAYWTMSPYAWGTVNTQDGGKEYSASVYVAYYSAGVVNGFGVGSTQFGIRPVINLVNTIEFNPKGKGTADNPYIVQ